ncbi:GNAT family N-acetyltransferase [Paenibacillus ihbetae]|nr:GNAT family N-acetyltransferase [Paenibacillus ihbetae]
MMNYRQYDRNDILPCTKTFMQVFNEEPWNDGWTMERARKYLQDFTDTPEFVGVIAEDVSGAAGFIFGVRKRWWSADEFFIHEMCVRGTSQQSGIGTGMLQFLERELTASGVSNMTLLTNRNIPAESFYKRNGFNEIDRLVFMSKDLK